MELLVAHVGHWWMWILYLVPVVIVLAASLHSFIAQRREER
jgi:ABC-type multidrug transport system permease subunit